MDALHSQLTTGGQSLDVEKSQNESPEESSKLHSVPQCVAENETVVQQPPQQKTPIPRKNLGSQRNTAQETDTTEQENYQGTSGSSECVDVKICQMDEVLSTASAPTPCSADVALESVPRQKQESKCGKYVCSYCGRACAKPSVLQKHIRSHTGERPYPCTSCGFSFKTKSNLYKHLKSHTHKVKAGLTADIKGPRISSEEPVTESDEERQLSSSSILEKQRTSIQKSNAPEKCSEKQHKAKEDSQAVKKRLAMRLSRGRQHPLTLSDDAPPSFDRSTSGSTESGYFSRSESMEVPQDSPPNTSGKSYAEIILGKFGRCDHTKRMAHQQHMNPNLQEGRRIPFTVPKKQVIDHITKLITINEAVVDTSKLDSVKPRRFSVSRKSSTESKPSSSKGPIGPISKELNVSSMSHGSITLGVPCEKFQHHSISIQDVSDLRTSTPLQKSHSMPSDTSVSDISETSHSLRLGKSFDDQQLVQNRRQGRLKRQSAIELPIGAEISVEDQSFSSSLVSTLVHTEPNHLRNQELFECESCGMLFNDWERFQTHKQSCIDCRSCKTETEPEEMLASHSCAFAFRKRRKEESLDLEDTPLTTVPFITPKECTTSCESFCKLSAKETSEHVKDSASMSISVIQHTSSFEKQSYSLQTAGSEEEVYTSQSESKQLTIKQSFRKLARQPNVQDTLIHEDLNNSTSEVSSPSTFPKTKDEGHFSTFQWPQRSRTLAQLPIEKLPPKKKRLCLAQTLGDSSFDPHSLPQSPFQDSCVSNISGQSALFKSCKADVDVTLTRRSRATHTLTVPLSSHREIRRSASEQAPHILQRDNLIIEARSKSFDHICLSPESTATGWKDKQKGLLIRYATVRDHVERHQSSKVKNTNSHTQTTNPLDETENIKSHPVLSKNDQHNTLQWTDQQTAVESLPSGAARAHYSQVSTGLKLEILMDENIGNSPANVDQLHLAHHRQNKPLYADVTMSSEQLRTSPVQRIPVRLHSNLTSHVIPIYTTVSQTFNAKPQAPGCSRDSSVTLVTKLDVDQQPLFIGPKFVSYGANKRVLSPTYSDELSLDESEPQQKQMKEEENRKGDEQEKDVLIPCNKGERPCKENAILTTENKEPFTTLNTNLTFSWCCLHNTKPNSSTQSEHQTSVYSSWSTSPHNPYPPGLTSKEMLSLLDCKQRQTSVIYTMAAMSSLLDTKQETSNSQQPVPTEGW